MRKWPLILVVVLFAGWFLVKGLPFLDTATPVTYATPIPPPDSAAELLEVRVKRDGRVCTDGITYGPDARYVVVTALTTAPAGPLRFEARAPGYSADARVPAGTANNTQAVVPIRPATSEIGGGTLCIVNEGRRAVGFYGVAPTTVPARTTVNGAEQQQDLSVTLLTSPSASLGSRLGSLLSHAAAFNPTSTWLLWIVFALLLVGAPIALGVALGRALAQDEGDGAGAGEREPDGA